MARAAFLCLSLLLLFTFALLLSLNGCGSNSPSTIIVPPPQGVIQHVVIIFQENRTPDNLFHDPVLMQNGRADIATTANSFGNTITLQPTTLGIAYDLSHAHSAFEAMYDNGKMDGASNISIHCFTTTNCPPPNAQFLYVQASDVQPYFDMAEQYTFGDRMFQTNQGPSFPAHQFIISGTSAPSTGSNLFVAENPIGLVNANNETGCTAPPNETVA
jgi:phospholipase C